jgi:hypothetical protein
MYTISGSDLMRSDQASLDGCVCCYVTFSHMICSRFCLAQGGILRFCYMWLTDVFVC